MKKAILISCWDWYEDRLKYIEEYLLDKGYSVEIIMSDFSHQEKQVRHKHLSSASVSYVHVPIYKKNISIRRLYSHKRFSSIVKNKLSKLKPDFVYCLIPPNSLVKALAKLKEKIKYQLVFDVIDLWPESFPKGNTNLCIFGLWRNIRDGYINCAEKIVLECDYYKEILKNIDKEKTEILRLIKEPIDSIYDVKSFEQDICLGYLGSINTLIDIEKICNIVNLLCKRKSVLVRIVGDGENREGFVRGLELAGADVEFYGKIYDEKELMKILGGCHFGINIYRNNIKVGLTMKSVSYFQLGLPILNSIAGDTAKIVEKYNIGINMIDISYEKIMDYIVDMDKHKERVDKVFMDYFSPRNVDNIFKNIDI